MNNRLSGQEALRQGWPRPADPRPIVIIGAGGIVDDAHMPAYRLAGFPVAGVFACQHIYLAKRRG